jgi:hypothetical protein
MTDTSTKDTGMTREMNMKRRAFLTTLTATSALAVMGGAALANGFADSVISQLTKQGFYNISVGTTLLGRVRIHGSRDDGEREIILNPSTGEILRDTWEAAATGSAMPIIDDIDDKAASNHSGSGGDDNDDNSGSNSGSGSSGSDSGSSGSGSDDTGSDDSGGDDSSGSSGGDSGSGGSGSGSGGGGKGGKDDDGGKDDKGGKDN